MENESEIVAKSGRGGHVVDGLEGTVGAKLLRRDAKSRVVVNFHGNAGHLAQGHRPSTYRSISGIPHTHLLTCDYRGFGLSTLKNSPYIPTEPGLITDAISLTSYILNTLGHPSTRTVLLGQSLGTAVTAATALYFTDQSSSSLPLGVVPPNPHPKGVQNFASIVLVAPFTNLPTLLQTYRIAGIIPVLSPLRLYPRIASFLSNRIVDQWPTQLRLNALVTATSSTSPPTPLHITILHARNDADITYRHSEALYTSLEAGLLGEEGVAASEERRSIHGGERVRRGAFAYRKVEDAKGERTVELEVVRFGGHNEVVGWAQVALAVRRAWKTKSFRPGLDVE
ncbi:Alpha/Beta hydrolase protein [Massariosphaeria phaeospora]|uniref:Alpha/Beta hydrolase protein n=1 Tax=Massariosphaeria phaeospora TaxID=100035 RepID=A0A7C8I3R3_9PLEO|nr:Alpha/Beta hydrolase protein [Massariosphaeria phaeospora]